MVKNERGSVLMEFVVVLPIYFMLLGFAFAVGELALNTIHLAASADRLYAMAPEPEKEMLFGYFRKAASPDKDGSEDALRYTGEAGGVAVTVSDYSVRARAETVMDPSFEGSWTKLVGACVIDRYTLSPVSRGFIAHWFRMNERRMEESGISDAKDSVFNDILSDGIGRTEMLGKDLYDGEARTKVRDYGYYSLQRNDIARSGAVDGRRPYRAWPAGALACTKTKGADGKDEEVWSAKVYKEGWFEPDHHGLDAGGAGGASPPPAPSAVPEIRRHDQFPEWTPDC